MPVHHPLKTARAHQIPLDEARRAAAETAALEKAGLAWLHSQDARLPVLGKAVLIVTRPTWVGSVPTETWAPRWALAVCDATTGGPPGRHPGVRDLVLAHAKVCELCAQAIGAVSAMSGPDVVWDLMCAIAARAGGCT